MKSGSLGGFVEEFLEITLKYFNIMEMGHATYKTCNQKNLRILQNFYQDKEVIFSSGAKL